MSREDAHFVVLCLFNNLTSLQQRRYGGATTSKAKARLYLFFLYAKGKILF